MTADTVGGVWDYAMRLSTLLAARGVDVVLATMGPAPSDGQRAAARAIAGVDLRTSTYALEWMPQPWREVDAAGEWLLSLEEELDPDVVHLNGFAHGALPWRAPVMVVGHSCVYSWWHSVRGSAPPAEWNEYKTRVAAGLAAADVVVAPSNAMRLALERHYLPAAQVTVIPNCADAGGDEAAAKEPVIFTAGRLWDPAKNIALVDSAADSLAWPVYAAGAVVGPDGESVCLHSVRGLGRLPPQEVRRWMSRASIYVLPARYEPFGLSIVEAALCRCALVLGDIESLRENWDGAACFVPTGDVGALRAALQHLIDDRDARVALGQAACARARRFSPERHVERYHTVYRHMVTRYGRTAHSARTR